MNSKKAIKFLIFISIVIMAIFVNETYAKYHKKVNNNMGIDLASWNIKLNGESVIGKNTMSNKIIPVFETNAFTAENVLAPGIQGYFDIEIDASEVDTSFNYSITALVSDPEKYPDIKATGYTISPESTSEKIAITDGVFSGSIVHNTDQTKIRIFIEWNDSEDNLMSNEEDTALAIKNNELTMNVDFKFEQIKG